LLLRPEPLLHLDEVAADFLACSLRSIIAISFAASSVSQ
jgi:hypothetical protein